MKALKFLLATPLLVALLAAFSFTDITADGKQDIANNEEEKLTVGKITWVGNKKFSDVYLSEFMDLKEGEVFNRKAVNKKLSYHPDVKSLGDLYMNSGHLYFNVEMNEEVIGDRVNLNFNVFEGQTVEVDKTIIKGNKKVGTEDILKMMEHKKGELFNRSKLIASQRNLAESGLFISDSINIQPIPHSDYSRVDFEFTVIEL